MLAGVWLALNLTFGYVFDWISYRTGETTGPGRGRGAAARACCRRAIPDVLVQGMPMFGGAIVMILGALAVGSGYGWGTWKTVFTQGPAGRPRSAAPWSRWPSWSPAWCWPPSASTWPCPR